MKKIITTFSAFFMALTLVGCSSSSTVTETTDASNSNTIEFDNAVVYQDENITLEVVKFYSEDVNWSEGEQNEKIIEFRVTNNSNLSMFANPEGYIGTEKAWVCDIQGSLSADPGKSGNYAYYIGYETNPEHTSLESLEDLYKFEAKFKVYFTEDGSNVTSNSYEIKFNLGVLNGSVETSEELAQSTVNVDEVKNALQGTWSVGGGYFVFSGDEVNLGDMYYGSYTVNTETNEIDGTVMQDDQQVAFHLPFELVDGTLKLYNNQGVELVKQ